MGIHHVLIALVAVFAVQSNAFVGRHDPQHLSLVGDKAGKLSLLFAAEGSGSDEWTTVLRDQRRWINDSDPPPIVFNLKDKMYVFAGKGKGINGNYFCTINCTTGEMDRSRSFEGVINPKVCVAAALDDDSFIAVGAWDAFYFSYPLEYGTHTPLPNLVKIRWKPGIVCVDDKVYVMGGYNPHKEKYEDTIEMLDMSLPWRRWEWTLFPSRMREGREGCSAVVDFNGNIVVTGGFRNGECLKSVEVFDTHTQEWRSLPPMLSPRAYHSAVSVNNGKAIVAIGGRVHGSSWDSPVTKTAELLRLDDDGKALEWIPIPSMNTARGYFGAMSLTSGTPPGIYVYGGHKTWDDNWDTMEVLPYPSTRDITYWTLLNPSTIKQKPFTTIGTGQQECYNQALASECIRDMEKERDDYRAQVNTLIHSIDTVDDQGWKRSGAIQGQTGHQKWLQRIDTLRRTADEYFSEVDGRIGRIRRVMVMMKVDLPFQGLPRGSWDFQNKIQVERWVEDTKREFKDFLGDQVHEHLMDMLDVLDHEFDKDVETWIEKTQQQRATEYCGRVRQEHHACEADP